MKLHWSPRSPFVRKVMIAAHELGLVDRLTCVRTVAATTRPHDDGTVLYDSPVICEYLDSLHAGPKLLPADGKERLIGLRRQALGDGFLDFLLLLRNERERAQPSQVHLSAFTAKRAAVLRALEKEAGALAGSSFSVGHIAIGCALSYLDFRFGQEDWRGAHPRIAGWHREFSARPSVRATEPVDDS